MLAVGMKLNVFGLLKRETEIEGCESEKKKFPNIFRENFYCLFFAPTLHRASGERESSTGGLKTIEKIIAVEST